MKTIKITPQKALELLTDYALKRRIDHSDKYIIKAYSNTIKEAISKETPMKPKYISLLTNPPKHKVVCSNFHGPYLERVFKFCPSCGQKIDWGYENDLETVKELVNKEK